MSICMKRVSPGSMDYLEQLSPFSLCSRDTFKKLVFFCQIDAFDEAIKQKMYLTETSFAADFRFIQQDLESAQKNTNILKK